MFELGICGCSGMPPRDLSNLYKSTILLCTCLICSLDFKNLPDLTASLSNFATPAVTEDNSISDSKSQALHRAVMEDKKSDTDIE